jgi:hypothetical protein
LSNRFQTLFDLFRFIVSSNKEILQFENKQVKIVLSLIESVVQYKKMRGFKI